MFWRLAFLLSISSTLFYSGPIFSIDPDTKSKMGDIFNQVQHLELDFPVRLDVSDKQRQQAVQFWKSIVKFSGDREFSSERMGATMAIRSLEEKEPIDMLQGSLQGYVFRMNLLLSLTKSGRAFLRVVLPLQYSFSISSGPLWGTETWEEAVRKSSGTSEDKNGWYSPREKRVYYDGRLPIISLIGTYIHEWVHAVDHFYGAQDFIYGSVAPAYHIASEHKAFRLSALLESELSVIVQNYDLARAWSGIRHGNAPRNMAEFLAVIDTNYTKRLSLTKEAIQGYGNSVAWDAYDFSNVEWWKPRPNLARETRD